jgi:hypothetical protein
MLSLTNPIAILAGVRPVSLLRADLTQVLKNGQVIVAQVLEDSGSGRVSLGIAGLRVEADTEVDLAPGSRFLAHVEEHDGKVVLRLVLPPSTEEDALVGALRAVVAEELPAGERVERLTTALREALRTATPDQARVLETLIEKLEKGALPARTDGPGFAAAMQRSGLFHEALLARAAVLARTPAAAEFAELARGDLKGLLMAALGIVEDEPAREALRHAIAGLEADQLLEVARARSGEPQITSLAIPDAHGWTSAQLTTDRERDERGDSSEGEASRSDENSPRSTRHARLAVRFSNLGSIRADFDLTSTELRVRFTVERGEIAELLRRDLERLVAEVGADGRPSTVTVFESRDVASDPALLQADVSFLRDHPLMDLTG